MASSVTSWAYSRGGAQAQGHGPYAWASRPTRIFEMPFSRIAERRRARTRARPLSEFLPPTTPWNSLSRRSSLGLHHIVDDLCGCAPHRLQIGSPMSRLLILGGSHGAPRLF
jgi:hypothetical protein